MSSPLVGIHGIPPDLGSISTDVLVKEIGALREIYALRVDETTLDSYARVRHTMNYGFSLRELIQSANGLLDNVKQNHPTQSQQSERAVQNNVVVFNLRLSERLRCLGQQARRLLSAGNPVWYVLEAWNKALVERMMMFCDGAEDALLSSGPPTNPENLK
jgi:hypothetical protein